MGSENKAFQMLADMAQRSLDNALGLPAQIEITPTWTGVGFTLGGRHMVAPMAEVAELTTLPSITLLPGVQTWMLGVTNLRGRLLPMVDMEGFFQTGKTSLRSRRVLSLEKGSLYTGLVVSEVFGMQHFPVDTFTAQTPEVSAAVAPFVNGAYVHEGREWVVFSPYALAEDNRFLNAAAA
jgi:twitching motility protein PilI